MNETPPHQPNNRPLVSVVMPIYNREAFLPEAIGAIRGQDYTHWELVVVDDGSSDNSQAVFERLTADMPQPVQYIEQENAGPYAARNTGLDHCNGDLVALYDSDDLWLEHHLSDAVEALGHHPEVSWVYADSRKIDQTTGQVVVERGFHEGGSPHPMLSLNTIDDGKLRIYDDPRVVAVQLRHNLCCLLQTSVIRKEVFDGHRFVDGYRNEGEDELFPIRAMKRGHRLAYFDDVHLVYRMHPDNSSSSAIGISVEKHLRVTAAAARGYRELGEQVDLTADERKALRQRLANEYFWKRGYALLWQSGRAGEAWGEFRTGLGWWWRDPGMWKTLAACVARRLTGNVPRPTPAGPTA